MQLAREDVVRIFGSEGWILLPEPWNPDRQGGRGRIVIHRPDGSAEEITVDCDRPVYALEADAVAEHIPRRQAPHPAMSWADTLGNMQTLDRWREAVGLAYPEETSEEAPPPVSRRPLSRRPESAKMKFGSIAGVNKPVSRLIMGTGTLRKMPLAAVLFDDFFERGGNAFDTAYVYGNGTADRLLGQWIKSRGLREEVVVIGKGAHTPHCYPEAVTTQLLESLENLQTDYIDLYLLHRDNPEVPVGEFVEVLNEHLRAGRIRAFGGSNWTVERLSAANEYARKKGLTGFAAVSNQLSLARMLEPPWPGCLSAFEASFRRWLAETGMPLLAWSSQARGFFVEGRADPNDRSDEELVRCWYCEDNFRRLERARELARKKGVLPMNIALAYVLNQPFPTFALIGPQTIEEIRTSFLALEVELTPEEVRWLNLET